MKKIGLVFTVAAALTICGTVASAGQVTIDLKGRYQAPSGEEGTTDNWFMARLKYDPANFAVQSLNDPLPGWLTSASEAYGSDIGSGDLGTFEFLTGQQYSLYGIQLVQATNRDDRLYHTDGHVIHDYSASVYFSVGGFSFEIEAGDSPTQFVWSSLVPTGANPIPFAGAGSAPVFTLRSTESDMTFQVDSYSVQEVPVPAALWLFISALAGLADMRRRARSC